MNGSSCSKTLRLTAGILLLVVVSGCATMKFSGFRSTKNRRADADHPVAQVVCIWQPAEGRGLDDAPTRGFAGQIIFLTADSPTPVEVDGDVTIFLFDDQSPPSEQTKPLHVFNFVEGSWQTHLKTTAWGPTYQLFLPYVRKGDQRVSCSLAVQIDSPEGRRVTSAMANIVLPGSDSYQNGTAAPFAHQHDRLPAGRLQPAHGLRRAAASGPSAGDPGRVVPASAQFPATNRPPDHAPQFESFSIPYQVH